MFNCSSLPLPAVLARTLLFLLLTWRLPAAGQAPAWQSARAVAVATAVATTNYSVVTATAVDAAGNVYLAGIFLNTVALGSTTLSSLGSYDVFVAKFSPASNQFLWALRAGGTGSDEAYALAVSGTSVYVAGNFQSPTADFSATTLINAGDYDGFVAKLTDAGGTGSFAWAQRVGGTRRDFASALAVSGTSVYVAGSFEGPTVGFGPSILSSAGSADAFVAKLIDAGTTGSFAWAQRAGGNWDDGASALVVSGNGVYVVGGFDSPTAGFGPTTLTNMDAISGSSDVFVAKLTDAGSTGSFVWAQRAGGMGDEGASALAVSGTSVYISGAFSSPTVGFGPATLTNVGSAFSDVFVAKLIDVGSTGSFVWAQQAGGTGRDIATGLAVSGSNVYVAGGFGSPTAGFGSTTLTNAGANAGTPDSFLAKLTDAGSTGSFAWAQRAGGTGTDAATALALSGTSVYVVGYFTSLMGGFGPITLANPNPTPNTSVGFLAALTDPTLTATTAATGPREPATLYPNPARRTATLRLPAGTAPAPLTLTDALGRAVRRYPAPAGAEAALDLGGLPAGLYLLRGAGPAQRLVVE